MKVKHLTILTSAGTMYATAAVDWQTGDVFWIASPFTIRGHATPAEIRRSVGVRTNSEAAEFLYRCGLLNEDVLGDMLPAFCRQFDRSTIDQLAQRGLVGA